MTNELPDAPCHRKREHVPHVRYEGQTAVGYCRGVGDLFPPDLSTCEHWPNGRPSDGCRWCTGADPFEGIDEAYENSDW